MFNTSKEEIIRQGRLAEIHLYKKKKKKIIKSARKKTSNAKIKQRLLYIKFLISKGLCEEEIYDKLKVFYGGKFLVSRRQIRRDIKKIDTLNENLYFNNCQPVIRGKDKKPRKRRWHKKPIDYCEDKIDNCLKTPSHIVNKKYKINIIYILIIINILVTTYLIFK